MKLKDLRVIVAGQPAANDDMEVLVWLPGSRIVLEPHMMAGPADPTHSKPKAGLALLIEGNLMPGSALD